MNTAFVNGVPESKRIFSMRFLIYASPFDVTGRDALNFIRSLDSCCETIYIPSIDELKTHLGQPTHLPESIVLMPKDIGELDDLISLSHLLRDTKVILMLPRGCQRISSKVNLLRPRFVGYADEDLSYLTAVIHKMADANCVSPAKAIQ